jgi:hypothetical protein
MCEFVVERVPVQQNQIGFLIGKSGKNFKDLQDKTKAPPPPHSYLPSSPLLSPGGAASRAPALRGQSAPCHPAPPLHLPSQITRLNIDKASSEVVLVGTRTAVDAAKLYLDTTLQARRATQHAPPRPPPIPRSCAIPTTALA